MSLSTAVRVIRKSVRESSIECNVAHEPFSQHTHQLICNIMYNLQLVMGSTTLFGAELRRPNVKPVLMMKGKFADNSNSGPLMYWAHSHMADSATIDLALHPHSSIEIHTWILEGSSKHFDTAINDWVELPSGSMQVIRAGTGLSHAERAAGARICQIWWDPGFGSNQPPPSYDVYNFASIKPRVSIDDPALSIADLIVGGNKEIIKSDVKGLNVEKMNTGEAAAKVELNAGGEGRLGIAFMLNGKLSLAGEAEPLTADDSLVVSGGQGCEVTISPHSELFFMTYPEKYLPRED